MSYSNNWMQLNSIDNNRIDNDTPPTTTTTAAAAASSSAINNIPPPNHGRGARPIRRRTRASRRTPTTLLTTDTTNFRAMVQQFTGGPTTAAATDAATPGQLANAAGIFDFTQHNFVPSGLYEGGAAHVQFHQNQMQQPHHVFMVGDHAHGRGGGGAHAPPESSSTKGRRDYDDYVL